MKSYVCLLLLTSSLLSCGEKKNDFSSPPPQTQKVSTITNDKDSDGDKINDKDDQRPYIADISRPELIISNEKNKILETVLALNDKNLKKIIKSSLNKKNQLISYIKTEYRIKDSLSSQKLFFKSSDNSEFFLSLWNGNLNLFKLNSEHGYAQSTIIPIQLRKNDFKFTNYFLKVNDSNYSEQELLGFIKKKTNEILIIDYSNSKSPKITKNYISTKVPQNKFSSLRTLSPILSEYEKFQETNGMDTINDLSENDFLYLRLHTKDQKQIVIIKFRKKLILNDKVLYRDGKIRIAQSKEIELGNFTHLKLKFEPQILFNKTVKKNFTVSQHLKNAFDSSIRKKHCKVEQLKLSNTLELISLKSWLKYFSFFLNDKKVTYKELNSGIKFSDSEDRRLGIRLIKPIQHSYKTGFVLKSKKCKTNIPPILIEYFFKEKPLNIFPIKTHNVEILDIMFELKVSGKSL